MPRALLLALALAASPASAGEEVLEAADRAWAARSLELVEELAVPARCQRTIALYAQAVSAQPDALEPRWKQMRALHFLVDFSAASDEQKQAATATAMTLAGDSLDRVDALSGSERERALLHFWAAIVWGMHGQRVGFLTLVREGVADRMRENAERAVALDPQIERGGAFRLLSRLHGGLPRVPFVSGWVDRDLTLPFAQRAFAVEESDPGNQLILAMALLERAPERRREAEALLQAAAQVTPRSELRVEDLAIRRQAREALAELE